MNFSATPGREDVCFVLSNLDGERKRGQAVKWGKKMKTLPVLGNR